MAEILDGVTEDLLDRFSALIGYDINLFFDLYRIFINDASNYIISFYQNSEENPNFVAFNFLNKLNKEITIVDNQIKNNRKLLNSMGDWEILDLFEDIKIKLETFNKMSKWTRSNRKIIGWNNSSAQIQYVTGQYETLEDVSFRMRDSDSQNDWQKIALDNNIMEIDYESDSSEKLFLNKRLNSNKQFFLNSVVDNLYGEKLYGIDLDKKLSFTEDNDLKTLTPVETAIQSASVLSTLQKGDIPEFKNLGINNVSGNDTAVFFFISIREQMSKVFLTDDTFRNFTIKNVNRANGDIDVTYEVDTFYNLSINSESNKN